MLQTYNSMLSHFLAPFRFQGWLDKILLAVCLLVSGLVFVNAFLHNPYYGYDAHDHINYVISLSSNGRLPVKAETGQYYSPPLPYVFPALLVDLHAGLWKALKLAQFLNALLAVGVIYYLLKICEFIALEDRYLKLVSVLMLGVLPVFYRSFALVRGEPFLAFLGVFVVYISGLIFLRHEYTVRNTVLLGMALAAAILSRQWGFFFLPPVLVFAVWLSRKENHLVLKPLAVVLGSLSLAVLIGGWFYVQLFEQYGTFTAFDRNPVESPAQYLPSLFSVDSTSLALFTDPIRPSLSGRFFPIVYADSWGDYWGYFLVYVRHSGSGEYDDGRLFQNLTRTSPLPSDVSTNRFSINTYLGWVNAVSIIPSLLFVGGLIYGLVVLFWFIFGRPDANDAFALTALITMMCGLSLLGFVWFVIRYQYPSQNGDLIKATYLLQAYPFLALLAGVFLERVRLISSKGWFVVMVLIAAALIFNLPAMITRYVLF